MSSISLGRSCTTDRDVAVSSPQQHWMVTHEDEVGGQVWLILCFTLKAAGKCEMVFMGFRGGLCTRPSAVVGHQDIPAVTTRFFMNSLTF